jgi:hypothetical protein
MPLRGEETQQPPLKKPEPQAKVKARKARRRLLLWKDARAEAVRDSGGSCARCHRATFDDVPEWHSQRRHVNHTEGRRGEKLYDVSTLEVLCQACHMPGGSHRRTA